MAPTQEPEIQFAQRLAANEKPMRSKAIKKLKKYISVRSQKNEGGFSSDELLKLWKGLFYCLWMQDKPLLQEELSNQISGLIHSFQTTESQLLFLETFLKTMKREWTGIDRLRMDKFFQLVRFMFRKTFEVLKRKEWDNSLVTRFLDVVTTQVLHSTSGAPPGLYLHILDLYMSELAVVGSAELTAAQNLIFIDSFCITASKTKNQILLKAICSSIFSAIVDQAPYAIEDLLKEVKRLGVGVDDSDSGQASEEDEDEEKAKPPKGKTAAKKLNGRVSTDDLEDEQEDDILDLESESESEMPDDRDQMGPVLQFDYSSLADRLFKLASYSNTPSYNRQKLYRFVKTFRDLSQGIFPQDEYPEEVSTDEDEMFGSRKWLKRRRCLRKFRDEKDGGSTSKKQKEEKELKKTAESDKSAATEESEPAETLGDASKKKKRRRKRGMVVKNDAENADNATTPQTTGAEMATEACTPKYTSVGRADVKMEAQQDVVVAKVSSVTVVEMGQKSHSETQESNSTLTKKKKNKNSKLLAVLKEEVPEPAPATQDKDAVGVATKIGHGPETPARTKKGTTQPLGQTTAVEEVMQETVLENTPMKKKTKKAAKRTTECIEEDTAETGTLAADTGCSPAQEPPSETCIATTPLKKRKQKAARVVVGTPETKADVRPEMLPAEAATPTPLKKKKKKNAAVAEGESRGVGRGSQPEANLSVLDKDVQPVVSATSTPIRKKNKTDIQEVEEQPSETKSAKKKRKIPVVIEVEAEELEAGGKKVKLSRDSDKPSTPANAQKTKKITPKKTKLGAAADFVTFPKHCIIPSPLFFRTPKGSPGSPLISKKIKCQTPKSDSKKVTFGLNKNETAEFRKTDRSLLVSPKGSSRVPFDPKQKPLFGVLKSPVASLSNSTKRNMSTPKVTPKRPTAADFF
ncbi:hypothetical protein UPYG_G00158520 [Umbra pygmaea]|uniref:Uncharacterized protein n=1 Tax=Umbra pygmaea TaxID=75934 RepID=A0ABD0XGT8_UMBPY